MKVLIVEDDENVRYLLARAARQAQLVPIEASDGEDAINKLRLIKGIRAIVTDHRMPRMTGAELLNEVTASHPDLFRVLSTNSGIIHPQAHLIRPKPQGLSMFREIHTHLQKNS